MQKFSHCVSYFFFNFKKLLQHFATCWHNDLAYLLLFPQTRTGAVGCMKLTVQNFNIQDDLLVIAGFVSIDLLTAIRTAFHDISCI